MKTQLFALFLMTTTALGVAFYPESGTSGQTGTTKPAPLLTAENPKIEVVFVLDTTGSMAGLIDAAKEKIWSIANTMASAQPAPEISIGLVAYRDRGDAYVTQVTDLSQDLDSMYSTLMDYKAGGGGDGPESVNAALHDAVNQIGWSQDASTYQVIFLVGDAPPHMDYQGEAQYPEILATAASKGIVVNAIRCGGSAETEQAWKQIAAATQGQFFTVEQSGNAVAIATPFDETLATLSARLDDTRLFYGDDLSKAETAAKVAATDKLHSTASYAARARRAAFNALESGKENLFGDSDLLTALESGETTLEEIDEAELPATVQALAPEARVDYLTEQGRKRKELDSEIRELTSKRDAYLSDQAASVADVEESLDYQMFEAVRSQAEAKGLVYEGKTPKL